MTKIFMIANQFLEKANSDSKSITHKQLQKLCYYAEVWSYGLWKKSLTNDKFEAWRHGPVNRALFQYYRGQHNISNRYNINDTLEVNEKTLISAVWEMYKNKTGDELEMISHKEKPWLNARKGLESWEPSTVTLKEIDLLELGFHFVETYRKNNNL